MQLLAYEVSVIAPGKKKDFFVSKSKKKLNTFHFSFQKMIPFSDMPDFNPKFKISKTKNKWNNRFNVI